MLGRRYFCQYSLRIQERLACNAPLWQVLFIGIMRTVRPSLRLLSTISSATVGYRLRQMSPLYLYFPNGTNKRARDNDKFPMHMYNVKAIISEKRVFTWTGVRAPAPAGTLTPDCGSDPRQHLTAF